jgi:hypothetical protein
MRFGTWNVRTLCRLGPLKVVARELTQYRLGLVGVHGADGTRVALNDHTVILLCIGKVMRIIS